MADREKNGHFAAGNQIWKVRSSAGPKPKFANPEDLWNACVEYFEWNDANPLYEEKGFAFQGTVTKERFEKMRAMTIGALCLYIDVTHKQWIEWRKNRSDLSEVIARVEAIVYKQKFEGASADLLNANIISRELGLADTSKVVGPEGGAIQVEISAVELARRVAFLMAKGLEEVE